MRRALAFAFLVLFISQAHAGDKKPQAPAIDKNMLTPERVGQLLTILRSDLNEDNRTHAAEELGRVDGSRYPEIIPLLIETLRTDPKPSVRAEVVDSLAKIRPVTKEAGKALEAAKEDGSFKVRWHARSAARVYHNAGFQEQDKKIASTTPKSAPSTMPASSQPAPPTQSGGWLSNLVGRPSSTSQPVITTPPEPAAVNETPQSGGWLYHMIAKPAPSTKIYTSPVEPPMAAPESAIIPANPEGSAQPTTTNPFADIRSAPAAPVAQPRPPAPPLPQAPVIPVLPSKPGESGLIPD
jgi:HEAT repeats